MNPATSHLDPPRIEAGRPLAIAGLNRRYTFEDRAGIPEQWRQFGAWIGRIPGQVSPIAYGVCHGADAGDGFAYLSGVEVAEATLLPPGLDLLVLPAQPWAAFTHSGPVATLSRTHESIWRTWRAPVGYLPAGGPFFERYDETFDARTGTGGIEIWVPLRARR